MFDFLHVSFSIYFEVYCVYPVSKYKGQLMEVRRQPKHKDQEILKKYLY